MTASLAETTPPRQSFPSLTMWSASPTPLTLNLKIDVPAVRRTIDRHIVLGSEGIMLAGTCGEGPWLRRADMEKLVRTGIEQAGGSLQVAVQVTDNSPGLILERLETLAGWGAKIGVVAQPYFFLNGTPARLRDFYFEIWEHTPLPVFFYDRGKHATVPVPLEILEEITSHPAVKGIKDSASEDERFAVLNTVRRRRPDLRLFCGNEFRLIDALRTGYDGAFFGGAVASGNAIMHCLKLFSTGQFEAAEKLDQETKQALFDIYGGPKISCWLSGLKYTLVRLGIFSEWINIPSYPLTTECRESIDRLIEQTGWLADAGQQ